MKTLGKVYHTKIEKELPVIGIINGGEEFIVMRTFYRMIRTKDEATGEKVMIKQPYKAQRTVRGIDCHRIA